MNMDADHNSTADPKTGKPDAIDGVLASALSMEDEISTGVYEEYLDRQHWPERLDEGVFLEIKKRLTVLIEDTKKHKKILQALGKEYGRAK